MTYYRPCSKLKRLAGITQIRTTALQIIILRVCLCDKINDGYVERVDEWNFTVVAGRCKQNHPTWQLTDAVPQLLNSSTGLLTRHLFWNPRRWPAACTNPVTAAHLSTTTPYDLLCMALSWLWWSLVTITLKRPTHLAPVLWHLERASVELLGADLGLVEIRYIYLSQCPKIWISYCYNFSWWGRRWGLTP